MSNGVYRLKPRLRLVGKKLVPVGGVPQVIRRRRLVVRACLLFPRLSMRKRWVRAAERLEDLRTERTKAIVVGIQTARDPAEFIRSLSEPRGVQP